MGVEIERKFLVQGDTWRSGLCGALYRQGYLFIDERFSVRVRIAGDKAFLTIKADKYGIRRTEYEYAIPVADAEEMLHSLCRKPIIEKHRYTLEYQGVVWEIDEFGGENRGLVVAEVELSSEEQALSLPPWVSQEVSEDPRYLNVNLSRRPYSTWGAV